MIRAIPDVDGIIQLDLLSSISGLRHGFSTRRADLETVVPAPIARLRQVHGTDVLELPSSLEMRAPFLAPVVAYRPSADALISNHKAAAVAVAVADCIPVLFADPAHGAIGAAHAGWRGLAAGVLENTVAAMGERFGTAAQDLVVGIGPAIGPCCFEVGPEVIDAFVARGYGEQVAVPQVSDSRPHANLGGVAMAVLGSLGVPASNIAAASLCTLCNSDWLWSYRADGDTAGRMICGLAFDD